jgi:hypothetical protein
MPSARSSGRSGNYKPWSNNSFIPGARQTEPITVQFEHDDYFEVLRFFLFALG